MATVGNVTEMILQTQDALQNYDETKINKKFYINPNATYQQVDTAARALVLLSRNTYVDTILVTKVSVNEKLEGEE